jgi:hypothetical protein
LTLIMQNKANLQKDRMNASLCGKKDCEKGPREGLHKNKPNPSTWFDSFEYAQDRVAQDRSFDPAPFGSEPQGRRQDATKPILRLRSGQVF